MTEYWLISAPGDKTCQQTWETMNDLTSKQNNLSANYKFQIPDLKVGTLDQLVGLSDDLGKLDGFVESITRKVAAYLGEVLEDQRDKLHENLMANNKGRGRRFTFHHLSTRRRASTHSSLNHNVQEDINRNHAPPPQPPQRHVRKKWLRIPCDECLVGRGSGKPPDSSPTGSNTHLTDTTLGGDDEHDFVNNNEQENYDESNKCDDDDGDNDGIEIGEESDNAESGDLLLPNGNNHDVHKDNCDSSRRHHKANAALRLGLGDLPSYITRFQWDIAKYPIKQSLKNIADIISKQVGQIDADLKTKSTAYNNLKGSLQSLEKKQTGSLLTRNLADLVKKEHFILDSEYLTTLLVIVPKATFNDWYTHYEKLTDMIVPRSTQLIVQDSEYGLFTVSLFKKVVEEFKHHARDKKFIVRDFTYNEEELAAGKNEITKLVTDKKKQFGPLVRWLKVNFSECFCAWIHVKALRVFVESVLRYGLPVNFQAILIHPNKKVTKRLRELLNQLYGHLDSSALQGGGNIDSVDIPGLGFGQSEYYPYVYYKINVDMIDAKP